MTRIKRRTTVLLLALTATTAFAQNQRRILDVTVGGGNFERGTDLTVRLKVAGKSIYGTAARLPKGSSNVRAWYDACTSVDEKSDPGPSALSVFCDLKDEQTRLVHTAEEPAEELLTGQQHAFKKPLNLPKSPVGTKLWIIVGVNYDKASPQGSEQVVGWTSLLYRCERIGAGSAKNTLMKCAYYTPGAFAIKQSALQLPPRTIHP